MHSGQKIGGWYEVGLELGEGGNAFGDRRLIVE